MTPRSKFKPQPWIFIDVDGTLSPRIIQYAKQQKANGKTIVLWSAQGQHHAIERAIELKALEVFDYIISKPGILIDDNKWEWANFVPAIHPDRVAQIQGGA